MPNLVKPELMAPAGYWPQLCAAIEAGADAVYFGLKHFTARAKVGFTITELPDVMQTLHRRGVKGYLTFNTLVFEHELAEAAKTIGRIAAAGVDALIVQDVGITRLARRIAPDLALHGSTQMSITSAEGVELARTFGVNRVILARELSLKDIRAIREQTDCELEIFVHGALCVSYSGQCFSSEAWGGRSANRGQCAQACRLPYELLVDDRLKPLGDARYLLSPGDLYALRHVPEMMDIGIVSLKIEGRYKDENYVALTTRAYRQAIDNAWNGLQTTPPAAVERQLEQVYSRGLGDYFISGTDHQRVVRGRSPRHRGLRVGQVCHVLADSVVVEFEQGPKGLNTGAPLQNITASKPIGFESLKPGDGVVFDAADRRSPQEKEEGGHIYQVEDWGDGQRLLRFGNGEINFSRIHPGDWLWQTYDPEIAKAARPFTQAETPLHKQSLIVRIIAREGEKLRLHWQLTARPDIHVCVESPEPLPRAQNQGLTRDFLQEQLGRLGNTPYELAEIALEMAGLPFAPASLLNRLRRQAVEQLAEKQGQLHAMTLNDPLEMLAAFSDSENFPLEKGLLQPQIHLLVRTPAQLQAALELRPASITLDYLDLYGLQPAVQQIQASGLTARVAGPRILKPNEERVIHFLRKLNCEIVVRSGGLLHSLQGEAHALLIGDFSLNAANAITARTFFDLGLTRLTPTPDLNAAQITELAHSLGPERIEVTAYHHLPIFHTEHCVFCRFLSTGTSFKDCGHPCEKHQIALRDEKGRAHPVMADVGCRNTVFGAEAQTASRHLNGWLQAGIRHYRLEFVHETAAQISQITAVFREALGGGISGAELDRRLNRLIPHGITEGSLFVPENYRQTPLLD